MTIAPLWLHAVAHECEAAAIAEAAALLARLLSEADGAPWLVRHARYAGAAAIPPDATGVVILSAFSDLDSGEPIAGVRTRWEAEITALMARPGTLVFPCNLFRQIHEDAPRSVTIERIRRLDLMLAELSHATGASVIDLDRALAHIGGRTLGADYRLASPPAAAAAAHAIAATLLAAGLEPLVPFEVADRAKAALGPWRLDVPAARAAAIADAATGTLRLRRDGRRVQAFNTTGRPPEIKGSVGELLGALRSGRLGAGEAGAIALRGLRRIGLRRAAMLASQELAARLRLRTRGA